jgi:hypothetical protein
MPILLIAANGSCDTVADIPWLSLFEASGTTAPGCGNDIDITLISNGLASGVYSGSLCVVSNDSAKPVVEIPIQMSVLTNPVFIPFVTNQE